jgi:hypothetical protein
VNTQPLQQVGETIASICQGRLGDEFTVEQSKKYPLQWEFFVSRSRWRVGGFAFVGDVWIRLCAMPVTRNHTNYGFDTAVGVRDRAHLVVSQVLREMVSDRAA